MVENKTLFLSIMIHNLNQMFVDDLHFFPLLKEMHRCILVFISKVCLYYNVFCSRLSPDGPNTSTHRSDQSNVPQAPATSRMILAILLIVARGGVWVLEQPASSLVFRHPRFRKLLEVSKASWWVVYSFLFWTLFEHFQGLRNKVYHTCFFFCGLRFGGTWL